jgi:HEAT repeat protein
MPILAYLLLTISVSQNASLDSQSPKERQAAIEQMAVVGNKDAVPTLAEALKKEPRSDVRASIVAAFGRIRERSAIPPLSEALRSDPDTQVRLQCIDSLLRLYIPIDESGPLRTIFNKVKSAFSQPDRPFVAPNVEVDDSTKKVLAEALQRDFNEEVRVEAARALGSLKAIDQIPALLATLQDPRNREHGDTRLAVVRTLGELRDPAAGPPLEKLLRDSDKQVVAEAVTSLGLVAYKEARPPIENLYRTSSDRTLKRRALEALSLIRDPATTPLFESLLENDDDYYRELAAEGLARLDYQGGNLKDRYAQEKKQNVRNALAFALAASGQNDYLNDLTNALDSRQSYQVEAYLYELAKFEGKLPELYRYLRSTNPKVRAGVVKVIGNVGDPSSRDQIQSMTSDSNTDVVREAVAALRKLSR